MTALEDDLVGLPVPELALQVGQLPADLEGARVHQEFVTGAGGVHVAENVVGG